MSARWSTSSVVLHWTSFALLVALTLAGSISADESPGPSVRQAWSKLLALFGLLLMGVTGLRLHVRMHAAPPTALALTSVHRRGIQIIEGSLYAISFALGVNALLLGSASAWPGLLRAAPMAIPVLQYVASREVYEVLVGALSALVALHVGGVVLEELRRGNVLCRMVPVLRPAKDESPRDP